MYNYNNREKKPYDAKRPPRKDPRDARDASPSEDNAPDENVLEGRNPVMEALRAGVTIDKLFIQQQREIPGGSGRSEHDPVLGRIISMAKDKGAVIVECDRRMLDRMSVTGAHQGVIAHAAAAEYVEVSDLISAAKECGDAAPMIILCDGLSDPGNLGAIIRTAEVSGAKGVIIPKRRSAGLTPSVAKAAAGALAYLPVARCPNVAAALDELKAAGFWIFGADGDGDCPLYQSDFRRPLVIVIGSEGEGLGRLVKEKCDYIVKIPMYGKINSLNASAAAAVIMFEAVRQKNI